VRLAVGGVLVLVLLATAGGSGAAVNVAELRPNIVVIETDDQRADDLRVMPNVRRLLAARGVTFTNSFVANPLCCPSRATFLTGQYSHNNHVWNNNVPDGGWPTLRPTQGNTLPAWLQRAGYRTILIGKYLNEYGRDQPTEVPAGWTEWHGAVDTSKTQYEDFTLNDNGRLVTYRGVYQTDLYAQKAVESIRKHRAAPFFMWLTFTAPHVGEPTDPDDPAGFNTATPAPADRDRFASVPLPKPRSYDEADVSDKPVYIRELPRIDAATEAKMREAHQQRLESLLAVDRAVAALVQVLGEEGVLGRTVLVLTSDNGYLEGEHRVTSGKQLPYEPSIRVPLVVRGPGFAAGRVSRALVSNVDLAPTFVALARARAGRAADGRSLVPLLRNPSMRPPRNLLIESPIERHDSVFTAVRTDRYLYAEWGSGDRELYDLAGDPDELTSRHADPRIAPVRTRLARELARLRSCVGAGCRT
jgi:N-acetylglucosamine-6-sulfatase